jgi:hypothetical protein
VRQRYGGGVESIQDVLKHERPGHRALVLDNFAYEGQPIMLTEFAGIAYARDANHTRGYSRAASAQAFAGHYAALLDAVRSVPVFGGWCYTQFTDTYQEASGLLYMDRTPKVPLEMIAIATRGPQNDQERAALAAWRERRSRAKRRSVPERT